MPLFASNATARDRGAPRETSVNQLVDSADAQIARLKADLRLSADQDKNWGAVQSALHDIAQRRATAMLAPIAPNAEPPADQKVADGKNGKAPEAADSKTATGNAARERDATMIDSLRAEADVMTARAEDLRKLADAASPLFGSLDDWQQRRFERFVSQFFRTRDNDRRR